ncbi:MAG: fibrobacter succinogenes major paralogous domain-containing protein [Fibromonadaceae bacterium]|jgi:uncharacterized protein (TIGR02145 family)|nr:fibrobacter succinogenes major paralogous domain-containing protein [Fibromonadaceae bacterium]
MRNNVTCPVFAIISLLVLIAYGQGQQELNSFTDSRDSKEYRTVVIGKQTWLAENLNYEMSGSKCYNDSTVYCDKYGRLYDWETAMKACPSGWHLPSDVEWEDLAAEVGGEKTAGKYLKSVDGWLSYKGKPGNGEDTYGFMALSGGLGRSDGYFGDIGVLGYWWSASEYNVNSAYGGGMYFDDDGVGGGSYRKGENLFSVRCLLN